MIEGTTFGETDDLELVQQFLQALPNVHMIYSCAVGDKDPASLPKMLTKIVQENASKFTMLVHDYFMVSPSYCLLDADGKYRLSDAIPNFDKAHTITDSQGEIVTAAQWRVRWFGLMQLADSVVCFSESSAKIIGKAFPNLSSAVSIHPHAAPKLKPVSRIASHPKPSLGVLGDIGAQKGAKCVSQLSRAMPRHQFQRITVVGRLDPRFDLHHSSIETGHYARSDIPALAERHQIATWLIPSIWPETFSYTTHEALATGLPVFCFDLGAQAEAVQSAKNGYVLPLEWAEQPDKILQKMSEVLEDGPTGRSLNIAVEKCGYRSLAKGAEPPSQTAS